MFNFNIKKTNFYQLLKWQKFPLFRFSRFFHYFFLLGFIFFIIIFFWKNFDQSSLGFSIFFLVFSIFFWQINLFFNSEIKTNNPGIPLKEVISNTDKYNLAEFLDLETVQYFRKTIKYCEKKNISDISSTVLFYFLLKESSALEELFLRLGLTTKNFYESTKNSIEKKKSETKNNINFTDDFQKMILESLQVADKRGHFSINLGDVLVGISKQEPVLKEFLVRSENFREEDIENITRWSDYLKRRGQERKRFWEYRNLLRKGSLGRDWASGYTINLDKFSIDWRDIVKKWDSSEIIGHKKEIERIERILTRSTINNVLLVGQPGTGRKSIIEALAYKFYQGQSLNELNHKRVVELDLVSLLSQIQSFEEVELLLDKIFNEVINADNIILVINEFHKYISTNKGSQPGTTDISGIIARYLQYPQFPIIAITTYPGLHKRIEQNPSLLELFEKVEVAEISNSETIKVLENLTLQLEKRYKVFITHPALGKIVQLTERYITSSPFPKKAIDLLEEVVAYVSSLKDEKIVLPEHIEKVLSEKTEIPIGKAKTEEKNILLNLEKLIHERIINQKEAVKEISTALRRARADITSQKKPMGNFLFLGSTGVGKTETSKALAEIYFKGEKNMIRLDMSEFQEVSDIARLIGSPGEEGSLTTPVRENPFSLVLLDEIEKAHPDILNIFLQVLDEGHITDGQGRKTSFTNSIIICTSNAGSEIIWEDISKNKQLGIIKEELLSHFFEKGIFRPEFINRFDALVIFKPLTKENLVNISGLLLLDLQKNLKEKGIELKITQEIKEKIVDLSYNPEFGAREVKRVIQDKIGNNLAQALLSDKVKRGDKVEINPDKFDLIISDNYNKE